MKLELLDINRFIEQRNVLQVKSARIEGRGGKLDAEGLYSEEIFGRVGSPSRKTTFGYIELNVQIIHPEVWDVLIGLNPMIGKMVTGKKRFIINEKGDLEESPNQFFGITGIKELIDNWDKLNLSVVGKKHPDRVKFLKKNRERIFIDKLLVLPAGIRDIQQSKLSNKKMITSSEVNSLYDSLIQNTKTIDKNLIDFLDPETVKNIVSSIQKDVNEISAWIRQQLKGKGGLLRGGLLSKTIDYSGRANIVGDPSLELGFIGIPWQVILKLYEPFAEYQILKNPFNIHVRDMVKGYTGNEKNMNASDLKRFLSLINEQPDLIDPTLTDELVRIAEEIVKDKVVIYKRDPVVSRESYLSGFVRVDRNSFVFKLNTLDTVRLGADFDGDTLAVFPLFTKESDDEAKNKMNPRITKSIWTSAVNTDRISYSLKLDLAATIYTVTKE